MRRPRRIRRIIACVGFASALALLAACSPLRAGLPEGFAELRSRGGTYRAVSPEGMLYRVRVLDNRPTKELSFWSEALRSQLEKEGYRPNGDPVEFESGERTGVLQEWAVPYGNQSYLYLTALLVSERRIALAEAAAPYPVFVRYRDAVRAGLQTLRLR